MSNSINKLNKLVNADWKYLVNWLNANKTEMVIFKAKEIWRWFEKKTMG